MNEDVIERLRKQGLTDWIVESGLKNTDLHTKTQAEHNDLFNKLPPEWVNWPDWKLRKYRKQGYFMGGPKGNYLGAYFKPYKDYDRDDHNDTPYNRPSISIPTPTRLKNMIGGRKGFPNMDGLIQHEGMHPGLYNVARRLQLAPIEPGSPFDAPDIREIAGLLPGFKPNPHEGYWGHPNTPVNKRSSKDWGPSFFNNPKYTTLENEMKGMGLFDADPPKDSIPFTKARTINNRYAEPGEWAHGLIYDSNDVSERGDSPRSITTDVPARHKRDYQNILNLIKKWKWE
jgi:hypothetical protein